ncbi:MAG: hypothetical protein LBO72_10265 [Helicobacteraceae bacterium]|nr:hypothetical protein [Helicobacteraceae bacterium]
MKKILAIMLLFCGCASKDDMTEFELELAEFTNPFSENIELERKEFLRKLKFKGVYEESKEVTRLKLFGGRLGMEFSPRFESRYETIYKYKRASNVVINDNKIRFNIPSKYANRVNISWRDMNGDDREIDVKSYTINLKSRFNLIPQKQINFGDNSYISFETLAIIDVSKIDENKTIPLLVDFLEFKFIAPHDNVEIYVSDADKSLSMIENPLFKGEKSKGLYLTYKNLEFTTMRHAITQERTKDADFEVKEKYSSYIKEYRYVKDGKLFKIYGNLCNMFGAYSSCDFERSYGVYFLSDGAKYIHFSTFINGYASNHLAKYDDLTPVLEYEKEILNKYGDDKEKIKSFKKSMEYLKHILSASQDELQKEFYDYKNAAPLLKIKTE